jgi:2-keto-3-deoxy-L-rhamnonate aldolase RhmA
MGYGGDPAYVQSLRDIVIVLMIEKRSAVECLEDILALEGVDMIQFGPADYSMNTGLYGQRQSPEVKAAERNVIETCLRMGIPPRVELRTPAGIQPYLEMGVRHFNLGTDLTILYSWWQENGKLLRDLLAG